MYRIMRNDSEEEEWHWRGPQTISSEDCLERADIVKIALEVTRTTRERVETDEMVRFDEWKKGFPTVY